MLNAELKPKNSCLEIRVINQLPSRTQHSGCGAAVSGYTGLWAGGSRHRGNYSVGACRCCRNRGVRGLAFLKTLM